MPHDQSRPRSRSRSHSRSPSPHRHSHKRQRVARTHIPPASRPLPLRASSLSKHDLRTYKPMFALYLDIQKQLSIDDLSDDEIKGRWKSFVGKWNRGELAEGWYDPATLSKAIRAEAEQEYRTEPSRRTEPRHRGEDEDDDYGPSLPPSSSSYSYQSPSVSTTNITTARAPGPAIPSLSDLRARDEETSEAAASARQDQRSSLHDSRRLARKTQKEALDELIPRAEPGTRERQLEKKREKAEANRSFAASKEGEAEVREADVMGDEDSLGDLKRMKQDSERKKNERELRREETLRARRAERELRLAGMKAKEEKTMEMLREIARARFGEDGVA